MAAVFVPDVGGVANFDCSDVSNIAKRWSRWVRSFELYSTGKGIVNPEQKKALLLHTAGVAVQDIYFTLTEQAMGEDDTVYDVTLRTLNEHMSPQTNLVYERNMFRNMLQQPHETVMQYIIRLQQKAEICEFADTQAEIIQQVVDKTTNHTVRCKLLERGRTLTFQKMKDIARSFEEATHQAAHIEGALSNQVNKLSMNKSTRETGSRYWKNDQQNKKTVKKGKCHACGFQGHYSADPQCPAKGKQCRKCGKSNHFESCCKTKPKTYQKKKDKVRNVEVVSHDQDQVESEYAFSVLDKHYDFTSGKVPICVGGVTLTVLIDSGASCNVLNRKLWESLKQRHIECISYPPTKQLFAYGSKHPIEIAGQFRASVKYGSKQIDDVEFVVVEGDGQALLGRDTAIHLNLLRLGPDICAVGPKDNKTSQPTEIPKDNKTSQPTEIPNDKTQKTSEQLLEKMKSKYPKCFEGIGKLKDFQLTIPIDKDVKPIAKPMRRVPYNLKDKYVSKIEQLEQADIIEPVDGPSPWVSIPVIIPKENGDIRVCMDLRDANYALRRERFPIPTVDEVLQELNNSTVFSKLDLKDAYHQIELSNECREITTFITPKGLYRYKRLMFGISCAPEMYQKCIQGVLHGCEGALNIMDDIIIHASSEKEHDERVEQVIKRLSEKGLTLNPKKCQLRMPKLIFMGHVLSGKGIGPTEHKVSAVRDAHEPKNASEIKSFLGLVNYSARYISDFATISEPLRKLTRMNEPFVWGPEQADAFEELKQRLSNAETLGYYDRDAVTKVITDASPVGLGAVLIQEKDDEHNRKTKINEARLWMLDEYVRREG